MGIFLGTKTLERRSWIPEPIIPPFPGADLTSTPSVRSKPDLALAVPTVWACVLLKAGTISSLPLQTFRRTAGVPQRIDDPALIRTPSAGIPQSAWLHMVMVSLDLRGNAYGRISTRDAQQRPTQIDLLNPDDLDVRADPNTGELIYRMQRTQELLAPETIWHLPGLTLPGTKIGLSPIQYAAATLGVDLGSRKFASDFFDGGGIPKAVLTSDQFLDEDKARTLKERFMAKFRGREPIVLGAGLTYQAISVRPEESQFLATQQANVAQIARYFGVPPEMVGGSGGNSMTYANVEQRSLDFLTFGLAPWLKRIEDSLSQLLPAPQFVKFDTSELLRTDAETTAKIDLQYLAAKVQAPSEIRERRGLPPMTDAQKQEADLVPLLPTASGGVKLPQGQAKQPPGPPAPVPADDKIQPTP